MWGGLGKLGVRSRGLAREAAERRFQLLSQMRDVPGYLHARRRAVQLVVIMSSLHTILIGPAAVQP